MSAEPATSEEVYRFDGFELRLRTRELLRAAEPVELQPKVFDLIAYLVRHRDRAIDKNELLDGVWPRQVVTEAALARSIMKARRALDDDAEQPRRIHTVHGRGYRFMARVEVGPAAGPEAIGNEPAPRVPTNPVGADDAVSTATTSAAQPSRPRIRAMHWLLAGALVLAATLATLRSIDWQADEAGDALPQRIAVMPIANRTGDSSLDWMELGLMSAIEQILREGGNLPTVAPAELLPMLPVGDAIDAPVLEAIRVAHQASHLVVGELQAGAGNLRLSYRVIDEGGRERRRSIVGDALPALARGTGTDLLALLGGDGDAIDAGLDDFVNEAFLRGRASRLRGELREARTMFELAARQAPGEFWPRYELALVQRDLGDMDAALATLGALHQEARRRGDDRHLRAAATSLALAHMHSGDLDAARELLESAHAAALRLGDARAAGTVMTNLSIVARRRGDLRAARRWAEDALATYAAAGIAHPPGHAFNTLSQVALAERRYDEAELLLGRALAAFRLVGDRRNEAVALNASARLARQRGDFATATRLAEEALGLHRAQGEQRNIVSNLMNLSDLALLAGDLDRARERAEEAQAHADALGEAPVRADARVQMGEALIAVAELDAAEAVLRDALSLSDAAGEGGNGVIARLHLTDIALRQSRLEDAGMEAEAAWEVARRTSSPLLQSAAQGAIARAALASGRMEEAEAAAGVALDVLLEASATDERALATARLRGMEVHLARKQVDAARTVAEAIGTVLEHEPDWLRARAELAARLGETAAALQYEVAAKERAGRAWNSDDERRLQRRRSASQAPN